VESRVGYGLREFRFRGDDDHFVGEFLICAVSVINFSLCLSQ